MVRAPAYRRHLRCQHVLYSVRGSCTSGSAAILAAIIASSLAYFFLADFLYIGRLAAYLSLADWPLEALVLQASMPLDSGPLGSDRLSQPAAVDRDELILSDVSVGDTPQPS